MAAVTWDLLCPTQLEVKPGAHPTRVYSAISGVTRTRVFGSQPVRATITASFLTTSEEAGIAFGKFHTSLSGADPVTIDPLLFIGHEEVLAALPTNLTWHFAREPEVSARLEGRVRLSVEFDGRIEV